MVSYCSAIKVCPCIRLHSIKLTGLLFELNFVDTLPPFCSECFFIVKILQFVVFKYLQKLYFLKGGVLFIRKTFGVCVCVCAWKGEALQNKYSKIINCNNKLHYFYNTPEIVELCFVHSNLILLVVK